MTGIQTGVAQVNGLRMHYLLAAPGALRAGFDDYRAPFPDAVRTCGGSAGW